MTERRPTYHALSNTPEAHRSLASTLEQHYIDGTVSRDTVLLLPILDSPRSDDQPVRCLHLIPLPCGTLGICNMKTEHRCPCCGTAMCYEHESKRSVALPDASGDWHEQDRAFLCSTCAQFPLETIYSFYTFRLTLNDCEVH